MSYASSTRTHWLCVINVVLSVCKHALEQARQAHGPLYVLCGWTQFSNIVCGPQRHSFINFKFKCTSDSYFCAAGLCFN
jgi:hypothetical protein